MANKQKALMWIMFIVIVVLAVIVVYAFVVKPAVTGFAVDRQNEGIAFCMQNIVDQVQQNQFVQLPIGDGRTLILVPQQIVEPQQQQQAPLQ